MQDHDGRPVATDIDAVNPLVRSNIKRCRASNLLGAQQNDGVDHLCGCARGEVWVSHLIGPFLAATDPARF